MQVEKSTAPYFKDMLDAAIHRQQIKVDAEVEFYLVNLLTDFLNAEKMKKRDEEPLVITMGRALSSPFAEQRILLKEIGDTTLYISGFFSDSFQRKLIDIDYYIALGSTAYYHLAQLTRDTRTVLYHLYTELSDKFKTLVDVLIEISEQCFLTSKKDLLRIYERWLKIRSKRSEELLRKFGIEPLHNLNPRIIQ